MENKLLNKVITISDKIIKDSQYGQQAKLKDEKNLTYNVYETKKDGNISAAWEQLSQIKLGTTVQIGYVEEPKEFEGKRYMARTIRNFNLDIAQGMQNHQAQGTPRYEANNASGRGSNDAYSRRLAVQGHINALLSNTTYFNAGKSFLIDDLISFAINIEDVAEKYLNFSNEKSNLNLSDSEKVAPDIVEAAQQIEKGDFDVSDIPF